MSQFSRPHPALYTVYVLRSTMRHASIYIGSTPNPPRRLKQHNGQAKGGAVRTARETLRPWEMIMLISGFPSMMAALKFEWALTNPHVTMHIPPESRITKMFRKAKRKGKPRRPIHSLTSVVSNLHLLVSVPSFNRWPLTLHFFTKETKKAWDKWIGLIEEPLKVELKILEDFEGLKDDTELASSSAPRGIHALPLDYIPIKSYVEKAHNVVSFEREGECVHCHEALDSGQGLHPMCPNGECEAFGHIDCWSKHALIGDEEGALIPRRCVCPSCGGDIQWGDMMKELSLRVRGPQEVEKLLKKRRGTKKTVVAAE